MRGCALLALLAACGRIGFGASGAPGGGGGDDGGIDDPLVDADPAHVYAGSCTSAATIALGGGGTVMHLAATSDGIVYGADYSALESYRFADGEVVLRATTTFPEIDGLASDPAGDRVIVLVSLSPENYTILDRTLKGAPLAPLPQLNISGDYGNVSTAAAFAVAGITATFDSVFAVAGASTATTLGPGANSVPAAAVIPGGFVAVTGTAAPACHWRWLDATGTLTGITRDDAFECRFPGLWPDDAGGSALLVWTNAATNMEVVRVMDLTTRAWLSTMQNLGPVGQLTAQFAPTRGWLVIDNAYNTNPSVVLVSTAGAVGSVLFTVPEPSEYVRLFEIAGRTYVTWITSDSVTWSLHAQQLCV